MVNGAATVKEEQPRGHQEYHKTSAVWHHRVGRPVALVAYSGFVIRRGLF